LRAASPARCVRVAHSLALVRPLAPRARIWFEAIYQSCAGRTMWIKRLPRKVQFIGSEPSMFRASRVRRVFSSSVGTKLLIGLTGLALFAYLIVHLAGNLLILGGQDTFNEYSHRLISNPLVVPIEIGLLLIFLIHVYKTAKMWIDNQSARPVRYQKTAWAWHTSRKSVASTTMIYSGLTIFLLVLIHVKQFKFGTIYEIGNPPVRDLYRTEVEVFSEPGWVVLYLIFVGLVAAHLRHGIASAVQSLGLNHQIYTKRIVFAGTILAVVIGAGFAIIPLWVLLTR
jgi:succinate dehydrogenase / fumarate reductase cytochrome b subunit